MAAADVFRDHNTAGVPASGNRKVPKSEVRTLLGGYETLLDQALGANVITSSANLTIVNATHKGRTINATALQNVTFGAASGFDTNFATIINNTSARVVSLVVNGIGTLKLWPMQVAEIRRAGSTWIVDMPERYRKFGAGGTLFVNPSTGDDANDGLVSTSGGPLETIQKAIEIIEAEVDCGGFGWTIKLAAGTYAAANIVHTFRIVGYHVIYIEGADTSDPTDSVIEVAAGNTGITCRDYSAMIIRAVRFTSTGSGSTGVSASQTGIIDIWDCYFHTFSAGLHIQATNGGSVGYVIGGILNNITGGCAYHWYISARSSFICTGVTITVAGSLTMTVFAVASDCSVITLASITFAGAGAAGGLTATKYTSQYVSSIILGGVTLPGATAGTTANGGVAH